MSNCLPLFHKWGDWVDHPETCQQIRKCTKPGCTKQKTRAFHTMGEWSLVPDKCEETRKCVRCDYQETRRVDHSFGEWVMLDGQCEKERVCTRCGHKETKAVSHDFGDWEALPQQCEAVCTCRRCGYTNKRTLPHEWIDGITSLSHALTYRIAVCEERLNMMRAEQIRDLDAYTALVEQVASDKTMLLSAKGEDACICKRCLLIQKPETAAVNNK